MSSAKDFMNDEMFDDQEEMSIDLVELISVIRQKLWMVVLAVVLGAVLCGAYKKLTTTPMYKSSSMIYIYSKSTSITSLADLQIGKTLAVDFQILAKTRSVLENVIKSMGLDWTYDDLYWRVTVSNPTDSHILEIYVVDTDPIRSADLCNAVADEVRYQIAEVMNTDEPSSMERAVVPSSSYNTSLRNSVLLGGVGCGLLVSVIISLMYLMDDTIVSVDHVKKYLGLNVLAEIPLERGRKSESGDDSKKRKGKSSRREKK